MRKDLHGMSALIAAAALLSTSSSLRGSRARPKPKKPLTEIQAWNAEVDRKKAEKKGKK